ncbi:hypothetical protein PAXRUDRAFT_825221 [Paxillus rubicundulus Ve08.2h10]|uniref:Uncharacterized protein n=1 Tax=Paxillus rubicundulus Ve08.2h10 TaxID=930991 RepID=A0A0D0EB61_9AGAM|nr:hypothetical protein PAXRUDRAFT_825221 [Paxillus rubicundulus Ve08.2h10]
MDLPCPILCRELVIPTVRKQLDVFEPCSKRMTNAWIPKHPSTKTRSRYHRFTGALHRPVVLVSTFRCKLCTCVPLLCTLFPVLFPI